jgi:hypothetical protein
LSRKVSIVCSWYRIISARVNGGRWIDRRRDERRQEERWEGSTRRAIRYVFVV